MKNNFFISLNLSNNNLRNMFDSDNFSHSCISLRLKNCGLLYKDLEFLTSFDNLVVLDLSKNHLQPENQHDYDKYNFSICEKVKELDLSLCR